MISLTLASSLTSIAAAAGVTDLFADATLDLRFDKGELDPRIISGATTMGWLFDQTGTLKPRPHNLVLGSDVLGNSGAGATVTENTIADDRGLMVADYLIEDSTSGEHYREETISVQAGVTYTWSFKAKGDGSGRRAYVRTALQGSAGVTFNIATGAADVIGATALVSHGSEPLADGWRRCWIRFTAIGTGVAVFRVQITNGVNTVYQGEPGKGIYVAGRQLNQGELQPYYPTSGSAYFGPRLTYDPANLSADPGLLAEEARTNLVFPSNLPTSSTATIGNVNINGATITTSGPTFAGVVGFTLAGADSNTNSLGANNLRIQGAIASATTYTFSCWIRTPEGGSAATLRLRDLNTESVSVGLGTSTAQWTRVQRTVTTTSSSTLILNTGTGAPIDICAMQLELGASASSPIPTSGTAVTRSADNLSMTDMSWYSAAGGVVYTDSQSVAFTQRIAALTDGTANNSFQQYINNTVAGMDAYVAGVFQGNGGASGVFQTNTRYKVASRIVANNAVTAINGAIGTTDTSYSLPTVDRLLLGQARTAQSSVGTLIREIAFIPDTSISDSTLQKMTK